MSSREKFTSYALWAVLVAGGLVLGLRSVLGPFSFGVRVDSPLNIEALLALAVMVAMAVRSESSEERADNRSRESRDAAWPAAVFLILLTAFAYWRATRVYFLSDDFNFLMVGRAPSSLGFHSLFAAETNYGFYRPIAKLSLALTSLWAGWNPAAWHFSNLVLHCANSILVFFLASRLCASYFAASFAAALFCIHGTRPEAVVWIAGRFDLLATFFVLCGLIAFMRSLEAGTSGGRLLRLLSLLCMIFAILSKESAYIFPLLLVLLVYLANGEQRSRIGVTAPFFLVAGALFLIRLALFGGIGGYQEPGTSHAQAWVFSVVPALKALVPRMWAVLFFPINWSADPGFLVAILAPSYVLSLGCLATNRIERSGLIAGLGFALISALPPLHMLLIGADMEKARLLYLPSVGFCLLMALAVEKIRGRGYWIVPCLLLAFNFAALEHNLRAWEYASSKAQSACAEAAACANSSTKVMIVEEMPAILKGVYFFGNGLQQCVDMRLGVASPRVELRGSEVTGAGPGVRRLHWDRSTETLRCTDPR